MLAFPGPAPFISARVSAVKTTYTEEGFLPLKETREEDIWTHSLAFTSEVKTLLNVTQMSVLKENVRAQGGWFVTITQELVVRR